MHISVLVKRCRAPAQFPLQTLRMHCCAAIGAVRDSANATSPAPPRFERGSPGSKPGMLPLHHGANAHRRRAPRPRRLRNRTQTARPRFERGFPDPESGVLPVTPRGKAFLLHHPTKNPEAAGLRGLMFHTMKPTSSPGAQLLLLLLDLLLPECASRHHCYSFYRLTARKVN